jgi:predicted metal-dependent hydrolase
MQPSEYVALETPEREAYLESLAPEELLALGVELYNDRHFWHAHEAWEAVWLDAPTPQRAFYQGLIQVTAAFVHVTRHEYPGSVKLLEAGIDKLRRYPDGYLGIASAALIAGTEAALARLAELGERRIREFDGDLIPTIARVDAPARASRPHRGAQSV